MTEFFRTPKGLNIGGVKIVFGAGNPPSDGGVQSGWIYFNGLNGVWYRYNGASWQVIGGGGVAELIAYDNDASGLTAENAQAAIDEIAALVTNLVASQIPYDNATSELVATDVQAAIDEIEAKIDQFINAEFVASEITYSNTTSGLTATNVQTAIDEVETRVQTLEESGIPSTADAITYNNTASGMLAANVQDAIDEMDTRVDAIEAGGGGGSDWGGTWDMTGSETPQSFVDPRIENPAFPYGPPTITGNVMSHTDAYTAFVQGPVYSIASDTIRSNLNQWFAILPDTTSLNTILGNSYRMYVLLVDSFANILTASATGVQIIITDSSVSYSNPNGGGSTTLDESYIIGQPILLHITAAGELSVVTPNGTFAVPTTIPANAQMGVASSISFATVAPEDEASATFSYTVSTDPLVTGELTVPVGYFPWAQFGDTVAPIDAAEGKEYRVIGDGTYNGVSASIGDTVQFVNGTTDIVVTRANTATITYVNDAIADIPASQAPIQFQDNGTNEGTAGVIDTINFTGSVVVTRDTNLLTVDIVGGGGGGGGGNLTADTTVNVPLDYATLGAALTYAKTLVPVNGAILTITVDDTVTINEQISLTGIDLSFVTIQGLGIGPLVNATGWTPSVFGPTPWLTVMNSKLGPIVGTWRNAFASGTGTYFLMNINSQTSFGSMTTPFAMTSGFAEGVAVFFGGKHGNFQATIPVSNNSMSMTTGASCDSSDSTYTGTIVVDSGASFNTEGDTIGVDNGGQFAINALRGGQAHLKSATITGGIIANYGGRVSGYITQHSEFATGSIGVPFIYALQSGVVNVYTNTVQPINSSTIGYIVAASGGGVTASGTSNAVVNVSSGTLVSKTDDAHVVLHGSSNISGSFTGTYSNYPAFIKLADAPASYSGQNGNLVAVNSSGTGLEFKAVSTLPQIFSTTINDSNASRTLAVSDVGAYIRMTATGAKTIVIPNVSDAAIPVNSEIHICNVDSAGSITFSLGGGVTLNNNGTLSGAIKVATLKKVDVNVWDCIGAVT